MQSTPHACRLIAGRLSLGRAASRLLAGATFALAVLAAGLPVSLSAQDATGTVTGRVQNAASGKALNLARVVVVESGREVFTNDFGEYRVSGLPAGQVTLAYSFTGMETQTVKVAVTAGGEVVREVSLANPRVAQSLRDSDAIVLDAFVVTSERETDAANIAVNEQRYSNNLKNVIAADAFGDVTEGNVGEFMKFLPGVSVDYVAADVRTMSVRGFADNFTSVSVNGARMASSSSGASSRSFEFEQVSINNVSRVEVSKAPTPSMPADSLGGSVNMISKNAFERKGTQLKYRAYLSLNSENLDLFSKTPGPLDKETFKTRPGFDFDLTIPVSKNFGLVVTGLVSNQFNEQHRTQPVWNHAQAGATPTTPFLQQYVFQDGPKNTYRYSTSVKADWKVAPGHVLSATIQSNYYLSQFGNRNYNFNVGTNNVPTPSTGVPLTYTPTSVIGATGRGSVTGEMSFRDKYGLTNAGIVTYRYDGDNWDIDASLNYSKSKTWYRDGGRGHFSSVRTSLIGASRVSYEGITEERPSVIRAFDAAGNQLDWTNLGNFNILQGRVNPIDAYDLFSGWDVSAKRDLDTRLPSSIKFGAAMREQIRDIRRWDQTWTYNGLNGSVNALPFIDEGYMNQDPHFGLPVVNYVSPYRLWGTWQNNPSMFTMTAAQEAAAERFRIINSQRLIETISSAYVQYEGRFIQNRLGIVTGVRYEKTEDEGLGPRTRGALPATTAAIAAQWRERGYAADKSYDDYYPSFHANYNVSENLIARFAYAKTLGRPDFSNILPVARVNDTATAFDDGAGTIPAFTVIVSNAGLEPWTADSYDFALEYYFPKGGVLSGGYFWKDLSNFWGTNTSPVTQADVDNFGLDPATIGLNLQTTVNVGAAKITGWEANYSQSLAFLPGIGKDFSAFVNGTMLELSGPNNADFAKFIEESASYGLTYSRKPVVVQLKFNYRGRQRLSNQTGGQYGAAPATGGIYREYYAPRTFTDINAEYQFSRRFTVFANARNIFNVVQKLQRYNDATPDYARTYRVEEFGVQFSVGVKGTW